MKFNHWTVVVAMGAFLLSVIPATSRAQGISDGAENITRSTTVTVRTTRPTPSDPTVSCVSDAR